MGRDCRVALGSPRDDGADLGRWVFFVALGIGMGMSAPRKDGSVGAWVGVGQDCRVALGSPRNDALPVIARERSDRGNLVLRGVPRDSLSLYGEGTVCLHIDERHADGALYRGHE